MNLSIATSSKKLHFENIVRFLTKNEKNFKIFQKFEKFKTKCEKSWDLRQNPITTRKVMVKKNYCAKNHFLPIFVNFS